MSQAQNNFVWDASYRPDKLVRKSKYVDLLHPHQATNTTSIKGDEGVVETAHWESWPDYKRKRYITTRINAPSHGVVVRQNRLLCNGKCIEV